MEVFTYLIIFILNFYSSHAKLVVDIPLDSYNVHVRGKYTTDKSAIRYLGLKYATSERFERSVLFDKFVNNVHETDVYIIAHSHEKACVQACPAKNIDCYGAEKQTEDCLALDISVPNNLSDNNTVNSALPVFVFFHGGAFRLGNINGVHTGDYWAAKSNAIIVTVSYRLGMFGFLRMGNTYMGNQALSDQINALLWVNKYIKYFGGDTSLITIAGHSAGAICVSCLLISPKSKNLFSNAIMMSPSLGDPRKTIKQSEFISRNAINYSKLSAICGSLPSNSELTAIHIACLSTVDPDILLEASEAAAKDAVEMDMFYALHSWDITVDGDLVPIECTTGLHQGMSNENTKIIIGNVNREGIFLRSLPVSSIVFNCVIYLSIITYYFGSDAPKLLKVYPAKPSEGANNRILQVKNCLNYSSLDSLESAFGHYVYNCSARSLARSLAQLKRNVFLYVENTGYEWTKVLNSRHNCSSGDKYCEVVSKYCSKSEKVCHGENMPFLFHHVPFIRNFTFTPEEESAQLSMYEFFRTFATSLIPHSGDAVWLPYTLENDYYQVLGKSQASFNTGVLKNECAVWDSIQPKYNSTWANIKAKRMNKGQLTYFDKVTEFI